LVVEKAIRNRPADDSKPFHTPSGKISRARSQKKAEDAPTCWCGIRMEKQWNEQFSARNLMFDCEMSQIARLGSD
jgi:hypothetical protein